MFGKINTVFAQSTLIQKYLFCCAVKGNEKKILSYTKHVIYSVS